MTTDPTRPTGPHPGTAEGAERAAGPAPSPGRARSSRSSRPDPTQPGAQAGPCSSAQQPVPEAARTEPRVYAPGEDLPAHACPSERHRTAAWPSPRPWLEARPRSRRQRPRPRRSGPPPARGARDGRRGTPQPTSRTRPGPPVGSDGRAPPAPVEEWLRQQVAEGR